MGLSIYYSGKLKEATELQQMIEEVQEIAKVHNWEYFVFEPKFDKNAFSENADLENLYGIMISPEKSEPLCFSFLSNGRMCGAINFHVLQIDKKINENLTYSVATKTQYAGFESHKQLILVLDYISKKYLTAFKCEDEGFYWETRDEALLKSTFEKYTNIIDGFASSLENIPVNEGENIEDYILRMAESTHQRLKKSDDEIDNLSIEDEIKFKKLKLEIENDAVFGNGDKNLPPEIENQFLDYVQNFESQYENAKQITVFEKIGSPVFNNANELNPEELEIELEKIEELLHQHNMVLDVHCDYENEVLLIYNFITTELFQHEIDDMHLPGMTTHFTYEEFHPNHKDDIGRYSAEFWQDFLKNDNDFFMENTIKGMDNETELLSFKNSFSEFEFQSYSIKKIEFSLENEIALAELELEFNAKIDNHKKIEFKGISKLDFKFEYGYWYVKSATLI